MIAHCVESPSGNNEDCGNERKSLSSIHYWTGIWYMPITWNMRYNGRNNYNDISKGSFQKKVEIFHKGSIPHFFKRVFSVMEATLHSQMSVCLSVC